MLSPMIKSSAVVKAEFSSPKNDESNKASGGHGSLPEQLASPGHNVIKSPLRIANPSPFREWATSNLSVDNEIMSPLIARRILTASFSSTAKNEASPPSANVGIPIQRSNASIELKVKKEDEPSFSPDSGEDFVNRMEAVTGSEVLEIQKQKPCLQIVELFTFEVVSGRIVATGFRLPSSSNSLRRHLTTMPSPSTPKIDSSGAKSRSCCCKKSKCLKLYCECFAAGELCRGCKCYDCANDELHEFERNLAVEAIMSKNSNAFAPKIVDEQVEKGIHVRGCRCKRSHCLKKYCECYQATVLCSDKCKCEDCHNTAEYDMTPKDRPEDSENPATAVDRVLSMSSEEKSANSMIDADSPSPEFKKPRTLNFSVMATPNSTLAFQLTPEKPFDSHIQLNMGTESPSILQLPGR